MTDTSTLLQKIDQLDGLTIDEKAQLKNLLNKQKEYGLVWEDKPEEVERQLLENLPVLVEVKERYIAASQPDPVEKTPNKKGISKAQLSLGLETAEENPENQINPENPDSDNGTAPHHILIEGDNLHALTALSFTHKEKLMSFTLILLTTQGTKTLNTTTVLWIRKTATGTASGSALCTNAWYWPSNY